MDLRSIDLNLLVVFDALIKSQSVTLAADKAGLSQSTMSYELAKLRTLFDDKLFVRVGGTMQPTPRALDLADPVRRMLAIVDAEILGGSHFVPAESRRVFTLCMSDIAELNFLPRILKFMSVEAPNIDLRTLAIDRQDVGRAMADGEVDLVIGFFPDLTRAGFYQQGLFTHTFACVVAADHPRIGASMTTERFLDESHIVVRPEGRGYEVVERFLQERGLDRRIVLVTSHFTSVPFIVASSELVTILPRAIVDAFSALGALKTVSLPFDLPGYLIKQHWHERFHTDAANVWLRRRIAQAFAPA